MRKTNRWYSCFRSPVSRILLLASSLSFVACGGGDDEGGSSDNCSANDLACGGIYSASNDAIEISFSEAAAGDQYIVMPYAVGDIETVDGAGASKFAFIVPEATSSSLHFENQLFERRRPLKPLEISNHDLDREIRDAAHMIHGRFVPSRGQKGQAPGLWSLVDYYDHLLQVQRGELHLTVVDPANTVRGQLLRRIANYGSSTKSLMSKKAASESTQLLAGECPEDEVYIPSVDGAGNISMEAIDVDAENIVSGSDYCIIYVNDPFAGTNTAADKAAIKASVETALATFKGTIFNDTLDAAGDYTFKPQVVIIDTTDSEYAMPSAYKEFIGLFNSEASESDDVKVPMVYMASDLSKVKDQSNDDSGRKEFHGTIAHELYHAISHYYRVMKPKASGGTATAEVVTYEEGFAHLIEDIFGHGEDGFSNVAVGFIGTFSEGLYPFLPGTLLPADAQFDKPLGQLNAHRGAVQSFLYYLASKKGGFEFSDGRISGGEGINFVKTATTSSLTAAKNLKEAFAHASWTWQETVGNFLISMIVDNTSLSNVPEKYQLPAVFNEITDLVGTKNRKFGFRFNNFGSLPDRVAEGLYTAFEGTELELFHYHTRPGLVTVTDAETPYKIESPGETGEAAAVVRIK